MLSHSALHDGVAHIQAVNIIPRIAQHDTLEVGNPGLLVGEELIFKALGAKSLVGIDGHRLASPVSRLSTHDTGFANLIEYACLIGFVEQFEIDGATPVVLVSLAVILENAFF